MEASDYLALIAIAVSIATFLWNEWKDYKKTEDANKVDLGRSISLAKYIAEKDYNPLTGEVEEFYQLRIPYQIQNKGNNPIIVDKVHFIFQDTKVGNHVRTFSLDFSAGLIVVGERDFKNFMFPITFSDGGKINELSGLSMYLRIEIRGYIDSYSFSPVKLEIEDPY